jgi:hypothetical protein
MPGRISDPGPRSTVQPLNGSPERLHRAMPIIFHLGQQSTSRLSIMGLALGKTRATGGKRVLEHSSWSVVRPFGSHRLRDFLDGCHALSCDLTPAILAVFDALCQMKVDHAQPDPEVQFRRATELPDQRHVQPQDRDGQKVRDDSSMRPGLRRQPPPRSHKLPVFHQTGHSLR